MCPHVVKIGENRIFEVLYILMYSAISHKKSLIIFNENNLPPSSFCWPGGDRIHISHDLTAVPAAFASSIKHDGKLNESGPVGSGSSLGLFIAGESHSKEMVSRVTFIVAKVLRDRHIFCAGKYFDGKICNKSLYWWKFSPVENYPLYLHLWSEEVEHVGSFTASAHACVHCVHFHATPS